jgi:hypothetical protein
MKPLAFEFEGILRITQCNRQQANMTLETLSNIEGHKAQNFLDTEFLTLFKPKEGRKNQL